MKLYSLYDRKVQSYGGIVEMKNDGEAVRALKSVVNAKLENPSTVQHYPEDYELFCLGEYDQDTGKLEDEFGTINPRFVTNLGSLKSTLTKDTEEWTKFHNEEVNHEN